MTTIFGLNTKLHTSFEEAVEQTTRALADQGFGVLTTIDVKATLKPKSVKSMAVSCLDAEILGDDRLHDLGGSAVDRLDAGVDERARHRVLPHIAVAAVQL